MTGRELIEKIQELEGALDAEVRIHTRFVLAVDEDGEEIDIEDSGYAPARQVGTVMCRDLVSQERRLVLLLTNEVEDGEEED